MKAFYARVGFILPTALGFYLIDIWTIPAFIFCWCVQDGIRFRREARRRVQSAEIVDIERT